ncbi:MAG: DUF748 domain-containing protein [Bacteroidota bacterium]|nr:DUF748 domain-containing protein [Bacteroidota bacterium]
MAVLKAKPKSPKKTKNRKWKIFGITLLVLVGIRLALPYIILHYANKTLATMHGYYGHIKDIDLSIYRGAYTIKDFYINKVDSITKQKTPFISSEVIDISVEWKSLFHGRIVGELEFDNPVLRFTKDKAEPAQIQKDTTDFRQVLDKFMPLKINRFEIMNGKIQYIDSTSKPIVNIMMDQTHVLAENLSSVRDTALLPARVTANANVYKGTLSFNMKMNPLADKLTFDMNAELKNTNLPELNNFFKAYANIDINKGVFGLYTEIAGKDGKYKGYVKPVIKDLDVLGPEDRKDPFKQKLWEGVVGTAGIVLENRKKDQIATKVIIEGAFGKTEINIWYAVADLLRNAFIHAIHPAIDNEVNITSVGKKEKKGNFFKRIFRKKE